MSPEGTVQITGTALGITPIIRTWAITTGMSQRMTHPVTVTITVQVTRLLTQGLQEVLTRHYRVPKSQDTFILMGKHKLHTGGASDTLQFYFNLSAKRGDLSVLTERQLDTNSRNRHLNRGR